ncbi:hypothetical protein IQ16_08195 [Bradyrhizobium huanghuaihaiense]|uniref:Uncharacterized protein n=1 Tax=Bradyrhizobium huanghuaihaiense TaxID=990078 RepID=A0A562QNG9_9BRAD|nr:hypothetical protein [Bradyrhizobium huanghuaihaiense]TWI58289.1 hypothetical protein IQ16_08195 [Bradyrhizobium huanghuaihaiense]
MLQLPTLAQVKLDRLDTRAMELHDAVGSIARRASELSRARSTAPASELASMDQELTRLQARLTDLQEQHRNLANLVANIKRWLLGAAGTYEMAKPSRATPEATKMTAAQAVSNLRAQIKALAAERVRVLQAALPAADIKKLASTYVAAQRERGRPKITFDHGRPFQADFNTSVEGAWTAKLDIGAALSWLDPAALEKRLHEEIDKLPQPALTMSADDRAAKLLELEAELLAREQEEEALIELAQEQGLALTRRLDADPRAVLGIGLARAKKQKPERVRAD